MTHAGTAAFHTLGCKLNFSETSTLARQLADAGYARVDIDDHPDVVVINTCSVTEHADAKCRHAVRRALNSNPDAFVAVVGCYAQLKPQDIAEIEGVRLVLGAGDKFDLVRHLEELAAQPAGVTVQVGPIREVRDFVPGFSSGDRTRSFLKVQDGCDYFCAFCTIPLARGRSRSASVEATLAQARAAARAGAREIVLTGVNIGDFGKGSEETFLDLVQALDGLTEVERFRISSIEPNLLTDEIISFVAQSQRFQPHFHIPLQSGSDEILSRMRRRYRTDLYAARVRKIKEVMPNACIGVDVIVGFPGEDDAAFQTTHNFLESLDVSYFHVFTYSERARTTALRLEGTVPQSIRSERNRHLRMLGLMKQRAHIRSFLGQTKPVLWEHAEEEGMRLGYTPEYVRVAAPADSVAPNSIQPFRLERLENGWVQGSLVPALTPSR
jgi:threonylcarbamoyladenosine tRNA methylthiotransferase MtaB